MDKLEDFKGLVWDEATMGMEIFGITGLSTIQVVNVHEFVSSECNPNRVRVWLNDDNTIYEVKIG